jgi:RimJ/RimL family protein N-acetyltransferase
MTELVTARLRLRPARADDLGAMHAIMSDARAMRYWSTPPHSDAEQTRDWLASMIAIPPDAGEDFIVEHDNALIGKAGLYRFPEVGFIFHPAYWGRGFAREALGAVLRRAFAVHGLAAVTADVDPRNVPSLKLLKRLGFAETGRASRTWQVGEEWCDSIYLALERPSAG